MAKLWRKLKWLVFFWDTVYTRNCRRIKLFAVHSKIIICGVEMSKP